MSLDALYRDVVLDHHRTPRGRAPVPRVDRCACGHNPACGDEVRLELMVEADRVGAVHVEGHGCAISTASGSMLAEVLPGLTLTEARHLADGFRRLLRGEAELNELPEVDVGDLDALQGVRQFPMRVKCALLPFMTLLDALSVGVGVHGTCPVSTEGDADVVGA